MNRILLFTLILFLNTNLFSQTQMKNIGKMKIKPETYLILSGSTGFTNAASANVNISGFMTIGGTTTNDAGVAGIVVNSDATGDGSLILSTANINATVERNLEGTCYHYISSPISNANTTDLDLDTRQFYKWDASMEWDGNLTNPLPWGTAYSGNLDVNTGYAYYYYSQLLSFEGLVNVGNYSYNLLNAGTGTAAYQGWNLIGNPYSACLDWDLIVADNTSANIEKTIYYFDDNDGSGQQANYRYYVASGSASGVGTADAGNIIPIGQGFFVKTTVDNQNFVMNSDNRRHGVQSFYKNENTNTIKGYISNSSANDEFIIRFLNQATNNFDGDFDARKLFPSNEEIPMIYTLTKDNQISAINSFNDNTDNLNIPVGIKANEGTLTIKFTEQSLNISPNVYLYDIQENIYTAIEEGTEYTFQHTGGQDNERFVIVFDKNYTSVENVETQNIDIFPNPAKEFVNINTSQYPVLVQIFDISGNKIYEDKITNASNRINLENFISGIYFIKTTSETIINQQKIIIIK